MLRRLLGELVLGLFESSGFLGSVSYVGVESSRSVVHGLGKEEDHANERDCSAPRVMSKTSRAKLITLLTGKEGSDDPAVHEMMRQEGMEVPRGAVRSRRFGTSASTKRKGRGSQAVLPSKVGVGDHESIN